MKRILLFAVLLMVQLGFGQTTYYSRVTTGNFAALDSWSTSPTGIPTNATPLNNIDNFVIQNGHNITVAANIQINNLTINSGGILTVGGFNLAVSGITSVVGTLNFSSNVGTKIFTGNVAISGSWNNSGNSAVTFRGGIANTGTFASGTGVQTFDTSAQAISGNVTMSNLTVTGITLTNNGILTVSTALSGTGSLTNSATRTLSISGTSSIATLANAGTMNVGGTAAITTVLANFTNTGTLNLNGTGAITGITNNGTVNLGSSGTIATFNNASGASVLQITAASPAITALTATVTGNTVNYNGAGNQTVRATTYSNLILSESGTKTAAGNLTVNGTLNTVSGVTLNMGTNQLLGTLTTISNGGTIQTQNTSATPIPTGKIWGGDILFDGANQTVSSSTYNNLTLSGTGTKTAAGNLTINGTLSIGSGVTLNMGTNQLLGTLATVSNGGTIQTQNTSATPIPIAKTWGGTVQFNGGAQTVSEGTYNNLTLSGSGIKIFAANTVINNITSIATGVQANLNTITTHTTGALLLNGANQVGGTWGTSTSGATNPNNTFFSGTGRITVPNNSVIDNNFASYSNATADVFASVGEYTGPLTLTAPNGLVFINTKFASYGTPNGSFPNFTIGSCHAVNSRTVTTGLLGNTTATIPAGGVSFNSTFGDPCVNTVKRYYVLATYALPICSGTSPGTITGSTPIGGNGTYTYLWEQSTTSAVAGFSPALETNNGINYTPGTLSQTTWYRRTVTSGVYTDATIVIVPVITAPSTAPTITALCSNTTLSVPASTIPGTYVEWFSGSCNNGTVIATGTTYNPTTAGTYFARYTNRCGSSTCGSFNVSSTPPANTVSITPTSPSPICTGTLSANLVYTAVGSPNTYSITWSPNGYLIDIVNRTLPNSNSGTITLDIPANILAGTYTGTITVRTSAGCVSASKIFTIQIGKVASAASSSPVLCQNTIMTSITHTTTGTTGIGTPTGLPTGVSASWVSNTITISGTPTASGTFNYTIPLTGACSGTVNATGTITVNSLPSAPTVGTITNVTCSSTTGSVVLSGLQNGWIITQSGFASGSYTSSGTSYTVTGLAVGNYNFTVNNGTCTSASTPNVPIADASSTTWNGSSWSNVGPDATKNIIIASSLGSPFAANLSGCSLTINTGVTATVPSGVTLTITNAVTTNGQLIFQNNASLVQTTNVTNTGAIEYRRISSPMKNFDFTYWSSPVLGQTTVALSPNTLADKYFRFDGVDNDWALHTTAMIPGAGYIIRVPKPGSPAPDNWSGSTYSQPVAFKGIPNNGNYSFIVDENQYNLVGNPYPSAIRADDFITANSGIIYGALYFWTHNTAITQSGSDYVYTADDYASYTLSGGTGTGVGNLVPEWVDANSNQIVDSGEYTELNGNGFLDKLPEWNDLNNNNILESGEWNDVNNNNKLDLPTFEVVAKRPSGFIAAGQSFFVGNAAAGNFQFTNGMRVAGNNTQFFKQASTKKTTAIEKNRVWLNLTNSGGAFKQLLVGYITGATNDWDNLYDGPSFDGQEFVDFYSVNKGQNLTIQGRALPFENTDVVPLGYRSTIAGSFDISIDNRDGALTNQEIWLEDKKTNTLHELSKGKYTFTAINGVENDRFVLKYTSKTLGTDDNEVADKSLIVSVKNKKITLTSSAEAITQVQIFDLLGRKVYDKSKINAQEWSISTLPSSEQALIVKTTLANGAISSKKIIF